VKASESVGSWVCSACETPEVERECCLCPVRGQCRKFLGFIRWTICVHLQTLRLGDCRIWLALVSLGNHIQSQMFESSEMTT
jgi:hypothetical protein